MASSYFLHDAGAVLAPRAISRFAAFLVSTFLYACYLRSIQAKTYVGLRYVATAVLSYRLTSGLDTAASKLRKRYMLI